MKKIFLLLICSFYVLSMAAFDNSVKFVSGDYSVLKNPSNVLGIELDMSKATEFESGKSWENYIKDNGEDYIRDWPDEKKKLSLYFQVQYNRKNKKGAQIDIESENTEYVVIVRPGVIDVGSRASGIASMFVGSAAQGGESYIKSCEIDVVKRSKDGNAKDEVVCSYTADITKGNTHISETVRIGIALMNIGTDFGNFVKGQK